RQELDRGREPEGEGPKTPALAGREIQSEEEQEDAERIEVALARRLDDGERMPGVEDRERVGERSPPESAHDEREHAEVAEREEGSEREGRSQHEEARLGERPVDRRDLSMLHLLPDLVAERRELGRVRREAVRARAVRLDAPLPDVAPDVRRAHRSRDEERRA